MTKEIKIGSIVIGTLTSMLIGWILAQIILRYTNNSIISISTSLIIFAIIGIIYTIRNPVQVEIISYIITTLIIIQFGLDLASNDMNYWKWILGFSAIGIFIINLFSGHIKIIGGKRIFKKQLGVS